MDEWINRLLMDDDLMDRWLDRSKDEHCDTTVILIIVLYYSRYSDCFYSHFSQVDYRSKSWVCNFCFQRNSVSISFLYQYMIS